MSDTKFIKALVYPTTPGTPTETLINTSQIWSMSNRGSGTYSLVINPLLLQTLQEKHFGRGATIKEVTAIIKDEKPFLLGSV